jgi:heptosyltransferase I
VSSPKRILIVRLGAMGDIIHAMPAVLHLRVALPDASFGWAIEKRWSELISSNINFNDRVMPLVDTVHLFDTRKWRRNMMNRNTVTEVASAFRGLRDQHYDIAVDFQGAIKSAIIAKLAATQRYGFAEPREKPASLFYTNQVRPSARHVVDQNLELASAITRQEPTVPTGIKTYSVCAMHSELHKELGASPFIILNPGAGWGAKQWPAERYAEVARALGAEGYRSLINFGPREDQLARAVEQRAEGHAFARQLSISQLKLVSTRASLFIGGDTGPLHLAAGLKIPVVALFGPTDPARTGPYGTRSIVLRDPSSITSHKRVRETEAGLMNISAEQVIAAARQLLSEGQRQ